MGWSFDNERPIYTQIVDKIKMHIISGVYKAGDKLPSVREIAFEAGVNPNTMQRAFSELENSGLVHANRTSGRFITDDAQAIQRLKDELAEEMVKAFLGNMDKIGYSKEKTIELINNFGS